MSLDGFRKNKEASHDRTDPAIEREREDSKKIEKARNPEKKFITDHANDVLYHWRAPEFEVYEQDQKWYIYLALILSVIIAYSVYSNSLIMSITFILIGVVGYMYIDKEPRILDFKIVEDGIVAGREIFGYESIKSFWIFYEPGEAKVISLHVKSLITPYVHIPIHDEDPVKIREALLENIEEVKQEHNIVDTLERLFRI